MLCMTVLASCGASGDNNYSGDTAPGAGYTYEGITEQPFKDVDEEPSSYFSLDKNTAGYSLIRYQIQNGLDVAPDSVRTEEMINYFDYDFAAPAQKAVETSAYLGDCPWNAGHKLMLAGIRTAETNLKGAKGNYVFLIDTSGSMAGNLRLGLAKKGLKALIGKLTERDVVSIVTYASGVQTVLDGGVCSQEGKTAVNAAIDGLGAGGSTAGSDGLQTAYDLAQKHFAADGNNRIVLISDGDFNVGIYGKDDLEEFVTQKAAAGIYLSVFGVGMGNLRSDILEGLAKSGNGTYAYLDNGEEAERAFCQNLDGLLYTVAKDAKAGVTFTQNVKRYRLIGYDSKTMTGEEFGSDQTDAGELGSNLCVAALYEIELAPGAEGQLAEIEVRYKDVRGKTETADSSSAEVYTSTAGSPDLDFIACVAEFGLALRKSKYAEYANANAVLDRLTAMDGYLRADGRRSGFAQLVRDYLSL